MSIINSPFKNERISISDLAIKNLCGISSSNEIISYSDARMRLGRMLHIDKPTARKLLIQLSNDGLIECKNRGIRIIQPMEMIV